MAQKNTSYIPYRESKLTRFLQDSIGKNSNTFLIATVSPTVTTFDETLSTLKFVDQAMKIKVTAAQNSIEFKESEKIDELQKEVNYLKELLNLKRNGKADDVHRQLYILKKENSKLKKIAVTNNLLPNNFLSLTSPVPSMLSTAQSPRKTENVVKNTDVVKDFKLPFAVETNHNHRYGIKTNDVVLKNTAALRIKTNTTEMSSSHAARTSSMGRSSADLQYAGAKILAGDYRIHPVNQSSMNKEDAIPVRIRSNKKMGELFCFTI